MKKISYQVKVFTVFMFFIFTVYVIKSPKANISLHESNEVEKIVTKKVRTLGKLWKSALPPVLDMKYTISFFEVT